MLRLPGESRRPARARCGPSPGRRRRRCRDAYFSQSRGGRWDLPGATQSPKPRAGRGSCFGRPSSRCVAVPLPCLSIAKLWPATPGLRAGDKPGKEPEGGTAAAGSPWVPLFCSPELRELNREAKVVLSSAESNFVGLRGSCQCLAPRPTRAPPSALIAVRALAALPVLGGHPSALVWASRPQTLGCQLPKLGSDSARVPRRLTHRVPAPALCSGQIFWRARSLSPWGSRGSRSLSAPRLPRPRRLRAVRCRVSPIPGPR